MNDNPVWLVSGDGHVGPRSSEYSSYVDPGLRLEFTDWLDGHKWYFAADRPESFQPKNFHNALAEKATFPAMQWDADLRLKAYDGAGIVAEVLFPDDQTSNDPPWGSGMAPPPFERRWPPDLVRAGARAYNRWLAEFCSTNPLRLLGLTNVGTLDDVDLAIEEVQRAYDEGLRTGLLLPLSYDLPLYHHQRYEALWELCADLGLAVVAHAAKGGPDWYGNVIEDAFQVYITEFTWFAHRPLWCFLLGGVLVRHPKLRVVITESGSTWLGELLERLDERALRHDLGAAGGPSELYRRQCYVVHSSYIKRQELEADALARCPNLVWGADTGHGEGMWPDVVSELDRLMHGFPTPAMSSFLGETALQAYNLDPIRLAPVAESICPTAVDLGLA